MSKVLVDREVLEQIAEYVEKGQPGHIADKVQVLVALRAALEQQSVEPDAIGCKCTVCGEWQRWTPSGMVCKNGHGGVPGAHYRFYTAPQPTQPELFGDYAVHLGTRTNAPQPAQQAQLLTDDDLYQLYVSATRGAFCDSKHYWFGGRGPVFGREIEQAVLKKNGLPP